MAFLAGLVIAALPDRAALTLAMVPSANISASFTTSTIRPQNKSDHLFVSDKTESCEFQDNWLNPHHRILWEAISSPSPTLGVECPQCHWQDWICTVLHFQWFTIFYIYFKQIVHFPLLTIVNFHSDNCSHLLHLRLCSLVGA